jgi:phytoene dehydrogenase-like protein
MSHDYDVIVIGAGAGGLFTAARLASLGYRTLVVERLDEVGGRAGTADIDGFKVNKGAIVIEVGGLTEETCREVGAAFGIREPKPPILYRVGKKDIDVTGGGWGLLLGKLTRQGAKLVTGLGAARNDSGLPEDEMSTADWVRKYTKNEGVHGIFRNMCGSVFAVSSEELPARVSPRGHGRHLARSGARRSGSRRRDPALHRGRVHRGEQRTGLPRRHQEP